MAEFKEVDITDDDTNNIEQSYDFMTPELKAKRQEIRDRIMNIAGDIDVYDKLLSRAHEFLKSNPDANRYLLFHDISGSSLPSIPIRALDYPDGRIEALLADL